MTASDRPTLSVDGTSTYITASQYNVNISGYAGTECWVIGDTAGPGGGIYNGGALTVRGVGRASGVSMTRTLRLVASQVATS